MYNLNKSSTLPSKCKNRQATNVKISASAPGGRVFKKVRDKQFLLPLILFTAFFGLLFVKHEARATITTVGCSNPGPPTAVCNASCSAEQTITENTYSYITAAWRDYNIAWDDQVGISGTVNGNVVYTQSVPASVTCGDVLASNGIFVPVTFFNGDSQDNTSIRFAMQALQKRTTEPNTYHGSVDFGYTRVNCGASQLVVNNACVNVAGTISATPTSCIAPCSPTVTWSMTAGLEAKVTRFDLTNGLIDPKWTGASGSNSDPSLPNTSAATSSPDYIYQLWVKDGWGTFQALGTAQVTVTPSGGIVTCSPGTQTVSINSNANFLAGGSSGYTWSAPSGSPTSGSGSSFSTQYSTAGTYTVTVTDGTTSDTCNVTVNPATGTTCSVSVSPSTIAIGGSATWTVNSTPTGFTYNFYGTDNFGSGPVNVGPNAGTGPTNNTETYTYNQNATHNRYAILSDGTTCSGANLCVGTCPSPTPTPTPSPTPSPGTFSCSVSPNPGQTGNSVTATASNGTGPTYNWTRDGISSPSWNNLGNTFSSIFNSTGSYTFGVTDNGTSNSTSCSVTINSNPVPPPPPPVDIVLDISTSSSAWVDSLSGNIPVSGLDMGAYMNNGFIVSFYSPHIRLYCDDTGLYFDYYGSSVNGVNAPNQFWNLCDYNGGGSYQLRADAYSPAGFVLFSDTASVSVIVPTFGFNPLSATCNGDTPRVTMNWDAFAGADHYRVDSPGGFNVNVGNVTTYTVNATNGGFSTYTVRAYDSSDNLIATANPSSRSYTAPYCIGNITVNATLDGASWGGNIRYSLIGPTTAESGLSVVDLPATGEVITQTAGESEYGCNPEEPFECYWYFTNTQYFGSGLTVWCPVEGPYQPSGFTDIYGDEIYCEDDEGGEPGTVKYLDRTGTYLDLSQGDWTLAYVSGGPAGSLSSITSSPTQTLPGNVSTKPSLTFTLNFSSSGSGPNAPINPTANNWATSGGIVACGQVSLTFDDDADNEDGFYLYRDTTGSAPTLGGASSADYLASLAASAGTGATLVHTYSPTPSGTVYYYWVTAYNAGGESATLAFGSIADTLCSSNLSTSDKDIVEINGASVGVTNQCGTTDPLPAGTTFKLKDLVKFSINLCNTGNLAATGISLNDSMLNLKRPAAGFDPKYSSGGPETSIPSCPNAGICYTDTETTINFSNIPSIPGSTGLPVIRRITFEAELSPPTGFTGSSARFQNICTITYNAGTKICATPLYQFLVNKGTPEIIEVP